LFGCDVKVTIVSATDSILKGAHPDTIKQTMRKLEEKKISLIRNERVTEIKADCVEF
jgi:NADH dehydrogenase FAD-containing subunit